MRIEGDTQKKFTLGEPAWIDVPIYIYIYI